MFVSFWIKLTYLCLLTVCGVFSLIFPSIWPFWDLVSHFVNIMTQPIINKRTDALKTDVNLLNGKKNLYLLRDFSPKVFFFLRTVFWTASAQEICNRFNRFPGVRKLWVPTSFPRSFPTGSWKKRDTGYEVDTLYCTQLSGLSCFIFCSEQEPGPAMVLLVEQMLLTCCSSISFVSKGKFSSFSLWFADKFDTDTEDWKPNFETAEMIRCSRCKASWDSMDFCRTVRVKSDTAFHLGQETPQKPFIF